MNKAINVPDTCKLEIYGDNNVVEFKSSTYFVGKICIGTPDCPSTGCKVVVGKDTTAVGLGVMMRLLEDNSTIVIGDDCMFSEEINVWVTDTHTVVDEQGDVVNWGKYIEIGDHVWIGKHSTILKNTKIADNSIVAWGAIVSGTFDESGSVIAGNPGRVVKHVAGWNRYRPSQWMQMGHGISQPLHLKGKVV